MYRQIYNFIYIDNDDEKLHLVMFRKMKMHATTVCNVYVCTLYIEFT
jgi:hypothetical protein